MINATQLSVFKQIALDVGIKVGTFTGLVIINYISAGLTNGTLQLPYPATTLPLLTIIVSQLDSLFVQYANKNNVPLPR